MLGASVVVAVFNGESTIGSCVESLLALDEPASEIIVVDNGSTDGTRDILRGFGNSVRILSELKRGPAAARNAGIRAAASDHIAFTDADCVVEEGWLSNLTARLVDPSVGIAGGRIDSFEPCNRIERFGERIHDHRAAIERFRAPYAISMNWASRKSVLVNAGLFDESLLRGSDVDLSWRIHALGLRLMYADDARIRHRNEATWRGLYNEGVMHGAGSARIAAKHGEVPHGAFRSARRMVRRFGNLVSGREMSRFDAVCSIVFDAGKMAGNRSVRRS
jgi:glycosyltransferase involved in cell wall biosynthesis